MNQMTFRTAWIVLAAALMWGQPAPQKPPAAVKMLDLFQQLRTAQQNGRKISFRLTETEVNEYLRYSLRATPRPGLESSKVKFFSGNYVSSYTILDFDKVERWKPGTIPVLLRPVLSGRKAIWVDVRLNAQNGAATFSVEKAYFQSIRLPAILVSKMIQIVAARQPEKYDTTKPVRLPFGLRHVWADNGVAGGNN